MMVRRGVAAVVAGLVFTLSATASARADSASEQLKTGVERIFEALGSPSHGDGADTRQRIVHEIAQRLFDWTEMGHHLLGGIWDERTPAERERFIASLENLVDAHVLALAPSGVDRIVWDGETLANGRATIQTRVIMHRGEHLRLNYRMIRRDDGWRIYDIAINDVSFIGTYRAQFRQIIKNASYEALLDKLEH